MFRVVNHVAFKLETVSERPHLDFESLLHRPQCLTFGPDGCGILGQFYRIAQGDSGECLTRAQMMLTPLMFEVAQA